MKTARTLAALILSAALSLGPVLAHAESAARPARGRLAFGGSAALAQLVAVSGAGAPVLAAPSLRQAPLERYVGAASMGAPARMTGFDSAPGRALTPRPLKQFSLQGVPAAPMAEEEEVPMEPGLSQEDIQKIFAIATIIYNGHVDPITRQKLYYGAVKGMAKELDPHSVFFTPEEFTKFKGDLQGNFTGIGVGMRKKEDGKPQVVNYAIPRSPADKAGVKTGDRILEINGAPTAPLTQEQVGEKIRGPVGGEVRLKLERTDPATGKPKVIEVTLRRAKIETENAFSKLLPNGAGYIYFSEFRQDTHTTVIKHVRGLLKKGARSLIIDVRNNPGGSLEAVSRLAASFLRKGQVVQVTKNRQGTASEWSAPEDGEFKDVPLKVLINGYSASASEVFSGALQDHKRAVIIGSKSYGKGTAQSIIPFKDGSALKLTMSRWYTPNGRSIQKDEQGNGGVAPDVAVQVSEDAEMAALTQIIRELNGAPPEGRPVPDPALDAALK